MLYGCIDSYSEPLRKALFGVLVPLDTFFILVRHE